MAIGDKRREKMQQVTEGYRGLELLFEINSDRFISALIIAAAMAAVGWIGVEYAQSYFVQDTAISAAVYL